MKNNAERNAEWRKRKKDEGNCIHCGKINDNLPRVRCKACIIRMRGYHRKFYHSRHEKIERYKKSLEIAINILDRCNTDFQLTPWERSQLLILKNRVNSNNEYRKSQ